MLPDRVLEMAAFDAEVNVRMLAPQSTVQGSPARCKMQERPKFSGSCAHLASQACTSSGPDLSCWILSALSAAAMPK